jgi:hypothetical protein
MLLLQCSREFKPGAVTAIAKFEGDPRVSISSGKATVFFLELMRFYGNSEAAITAMHICTGSRHVASAAIAKAEKNSPGSC